MATADDYLRAAEEVRRNTRHLSEAQRIAANPEPWLQAAAVAVGAANAVAPGIEAIRKGALAYLLNENRAATEGVLRGALDVIAAQARANPELARTIQRTLELQRQQTTTSASPAVANPAEPDPAHAAARDLAEDEGFVELVNATREEIESDDVPVPEELYDLGLEIEQIYGFIAVYLALFIGFELYEHPTLALAVDKVSEFYAFAHLIYTLLAHRSFQEE
jgi:hypothetical protein